LTDHLLKVFSKDLVRISLILLVSEINKYKGKKDLCCDFYTNSSNSVDYIQLSIN